MGKYFDELSRAMEYLGEQPDTMFLGQAVEYAGTAMTNTLKGVDRSKLLEMPVNEEMQMGIIRVGIGSVRPLNPQVQHTGDFTQIFRGMLRNIEVIRCDEPEDIFPAYHKAYNRTDGKSTLIVEFGDYYGEK